MIGPEQRWVLTDLIFTRVFFDERPIRAEISQEIGVCAATRENGNEAAVGLRIIARFFQGFPAVFEKNAVLWIDPFGFLRQDPEEFGVEEVGVLKDRASRDETGVLRRLQGIRVFQFRNVEPRYRFNAVANIAAKFLDIRGTRKTARHPNDGDAVDHFGGGMMISHGFRASLRLCCEPMLPFVAPLCGLLR